MSARHRPHIRLKRGASFTRRYFSACPPAESDEAALTNKMLLRQLHASQKSLSQAEMSRQAIQALSAELLSLASIDALSRRLLEGLCTLVAANHGSVMLLDELGTRLNIVADLGLPADTKRSIPVDTGIAGGILWRKEPALLIGSLAHGHGIQRAVQCALVIPIICGTASIGVVNLNRRFGTKPFDAVELELAATVVATFSAMFNAVRQQERSREQLLATIKALVLAIEAKDPYTRGHCERVAKYCRGVADNLQLDTNLVEEIEIGASLHDVGKIGVPEEILLKPGQLSESERELVQRHPDIGADIVAPVGLSDATMATIRHHHERFDGGGYPHGLRGYQIPLGARILAIADAFDAMTLARPYRGARSFVQAYSELKRCAGGQFDPQLVDVFLRYCIAEKLHERLASISQVGLQQQFFKSSDVEVVEA